MKEKINLFTRILERFRLREPLPEAARKLVYSYMRGSISDALKHFGDYTIVNRLTVNAFYAARAIKLRPSMAQSRAMVGTAAVISAAAAGLIAYMLFASVEKPAAVVTVVSPEKPEAVEVIEKIEEKKAAPPAEKVETIKVKRIGVKPITSSFMEKRALSSATDTIYKRISAIKGKERVIKLSGGKQGYSCLLSGSVEKLGKNFVITADLIDAESGKVIYNKLERTGDRDNINNIFKRIAEEAAGKAEF